MADNTAVLVGYKRCVGVATVQGSLKDKGVAHDAAAVASWFVSIPWNSSSDKITAKVAANYLRIHGRLTPKIMGILDQAESTFGRRHALTAVTTLEVLCSKTSVQSSVGLQDTLLEYVFDGVYVGAAVAATSAASEEAARAGSIVAPAPASAARAATVAAASGAASSVVPPCPRKRPTLLDPSIRLIDLAARLHEEPAAKKPRKSASSAPCSVPQHVRLGEQPVPTTSSETLPRHVTQCPPLHKKPDLKKIDAVMECSEPASSSSAASSSTVKAKATCKGEASADKLTTSLEKQKFVAAKRLEAHDRAVPGKPVEYVSSCGVFLRKRCHR